LIETENIDSEFLIVASGTAVSQGREAIRLLEEDEGLCRTVAVLYCQWTKTSATRLWRDG